MDWSLLHMLNSFLAHHDWVEDPLTWYVNASELLFIGLLLAMFVVARSSSRAAARRAAVAAGLSAGVALGLGLIVSHVVDRARPFVADPSGVHLFSQHVADAGFPSDHATASFAIAFAILLRVRHYGWLALAMAILVSIGRVGLGFHFPSDVLAGAALGSATAISLWMSPINRQINLVVDWLGSIFDRTFGAVAARVRFQGRSN